MRERSRPGNNARVPMVAWSALASRRVPCVKVPPQKCRMSWPSRCHMPSADVQRRLVAVDRQLTELVAKSHRAVPGDEERGAALQVEKAQLLAELRAAHAGTPAARPR